MIERHIKIMRLFILESENYKSADDIAAILSVSNRTVRSDIKYINTLFSDPVITSVKGRGFRLNLEQYHIETIEHYINDYANKDSEILMNLGYRLLMQHDPTTTERLIADLKITKNEFLDYLQRFANWCQSFDVLVESVRNKGVCIKGNEMNIRNAILHLSQLTSKNKSIEDIILADIPKVHLEQITQIIKRVLIYNHIQATQIQLKQLIIHLIIIYKRQNISYKAWDIKPKSFEIANQCITEINNRLGYDLNRETTKLFSFFISDYFEQHDLGFEQLFVKSYIERLIVQMEQNIGVGFTQDSVLRDNIFSHFSRTYHRIIKNVYINNPLTQDIKKHYPFIFDALYDIVKELEVDADIHLVEDEIAFLALHFQSSVERNEQEKIKIVIACYYGLGISSLLEAKILKLDERIEVIDTVQLDSVYDYHFDGIDVLVTTHEIEGNHLPKRLSQVTVSPLFSNEDAEKVKVIINQINNNVINQADLSSVQVDVVGGDDEVTDMAVVFDKAQSILNNNHAITESYIPSALEREKFASTFIGNAISMPHGNPKEVLKSHVIVFKHEHGLLWKQNKVKLVFFLAITEADIPIMKKIIHNIADLTENDVDQYLLLDEQVLQKKIMTLIRE
ncbi:PTS mannose transporter subunit IIA [Staphylococcus gallinarum]|uniref:BglG family transcription antiterminator n=2 Tax=Staphylococcus TaxID=1279 RepID=UPI000D1DF5A3|nr:BglG family transcription antiterminator [Staphylococcus gallinarum]PTL18282.1 PTS mannose transporter subunit IIA [Staphylococcus gallinarum]RIO80893.1 PRD domain-containing protein [Staphylococcus gallinarum]